MDAYLDAGHPSMDEFDDLRMDDTVASPPLRTRSVKKKKKRVAFRESYPEESSSVAAFEHAAAGVAAAGVMASALAHPPATATGKLPWKPMVMTLAAVGVGALYIGVLYFLYKKLSALESSLTETVEEMRKLAQFVESDQKIEDEPVPASAPRPIFPSKNEENAVHHLSKSLAGLQISSHDTPKESRLDEYDKENDDDDTVEEGPPPPKVQELPTPPRKTMTTTPTRSRKRRAVSAAPKPVVLDLDGPSSISPPAIPASAEEDA